MTQHTNFSERLDDLQQRVGTARSAVQTAATESEAQLKTRIESARPSWTSRPGRPAEVSEAAEGSGQVGAARRGLQEE